MNPSAAGVTASSPAWATTVRTEWVRLVAAEPAEKANEEIRGLAALGDGSIVGGGTSGGDVMLVRYAPDGRLLETRVFETEQVERVADVAAGTDGSLYVVGTLQVGPEDGDLLLLKIDPDGREIWRRTFGGPTQDDGRAVAIGRDGSVYATGQADFFGLTGQPATPTGPDLLLVKVSPEGDLAWERRLHHQWVESGEGVAVGTDGSAYLAGTTGGFSDDMQQPRQEAVLLAKYDPDGNLLWQRTYDTAGDDQANAVAAGPDGLLYVTGRSDDTTDGSRLGGGNDRLLVLALTPEGEIAWVQASPYPGFASGEAIAATPDGYLYVAATVASAETHVPSLFGIEVLRLFR